jgi:alpha-mannosidase
MFKDFLLERIAAQINALEHLRYQNIISVKEFFATEEPAGFEYPGFVAPGKKSRTMRVGEYWSGRDLYIWLHTDFLAPVEWKGRDVLGVFDFGQTGSGNNSGFESLLFIDHIPWQGVDSNHQEVFFNPQGKKRSFDFRLWSGLEGGGQKRNMDHKIKRAFFCTLEHTVDELYYLLLNMTNTIKGLNDDDPVRVVLTNILVEGYKLLDFTNPGSPAFINSARKTLDYYEKTLKTVKQQKDVSVSFIGHTHIDLAWLWRYKHSREKGERSFLTVLRLMERYPEYIFLQSQAQIYESIKEDNPELFKAIAKKAAEGRWEASGSMWVEADCNIPSGESLVRQILFGKGFFKKEFGTDNVFLWLPDVFGYNWAMPQILKKSGIDVFITTKLSWNEINRMPHDTFMWTGIDGSKVLTHFITTPDTMSTKFYTYNGEVQSDTVKGLWNSYRDKALNRDLLFSYGFGDGGGGPTRNMLENIRSLSKLPGIPALKTERVDVYLKRLNKKINRNNTSRLLHNWDRELYLEFHRGTYTSQAYIKKMNRRLELLYRNAEIIQSLLSLKTRKWNNEAWDKLREGWKRILKTQFHDIIPGSSIGEVYDDVRKEHLEAWDLGQKVLDEALDKLTEKKENTFSVHNTTGWERSGMVQFPVPEKSKLLAGPEGALLTQISRDAEDKPVLYVWINNIAPLGSLVINVKDTGAVPPPLAGSKNEFTFQKNAVETPFYKIKWNTHGQIVSIYDKHARREILSGTGNELQIFEDRPRICDAWEMESTIDVKREVINNLISVKEVESGPLFARIRFVWTYNKSVITQDMLLYTMHGRIDFKTEVNWQERSKLLKTSFPVHIRSVTARYEIQYGSLERNTTRSTSWDEAQFEVPAHQWADYSETGFGVALMNDSKYGYDIKDGVMRLSLLKSAEYPDPEADRGIHQFIYSLYSHTEPWHESELVPLAWDLNDPLALIPGKSLMHDLVKISSLGKGSSSRSSAHLCAAVDAIKKSEDGKDLIIRLHEMYGGRGKIKIEFGIPVYGWAEANLMEEPRKKFKVGSVIRKELYPFEIVTYRIRIST